MADSNFDSFGHEIFKKKYQGVFDTPFDYYKHLASIVSLGDDSLANKFFEMMWEKRFSPGGRILAYAGRPDSRMSLVNCTTHSIEEDSLESISSAAFSIMRASSRGQGIGIDISALRPKDAPVNNAAITSTGAISFMEMLNSIGGTIGQEGRRAAMLFSISDSHPDLFRPDDKSVVCPKCGGKGCKHCNNGFIPYDFIHVKRIPGKVENANISVKISDAFMRAVELDHMWELGYTGRSGKKVFDVSRTLPARDLFHAIAKSAHESAEPGVLYWDMSKRKSNSDRFGDEWAVQSVNACSEQVLDQDGVCVLGSLNLSAYVANPFTADAKFDYDKFMEDIALGVEFLDNIVSLELQNGNYISDRQKRSLEYLRRIGLGVMGMADMLGMMGFPYANEPATRAFLEGIFSTLRDTAYKASIRLGREKGVAKVWDETEGYRYDILQGGFFSSLPNWTKADILQYGTRNVAIISIAPTGSISNLLGVSSGIEPLFALEYTRMTRINGYDQFVDYVQPSVEASRKAGMPDSIWQTAYQVSPTDHVRIQALIQQFVDSSISKTTNLPKKASILDIQEVYKLGWQLGLKGMSVYRDGSRETQVLKVKDSGDKCPNCGADLAHHEGCVECPACSWSACTL